MGTQERAQCDARIEDLYLMEQQQREAVIAEGTESAPELQRSEESQISMRAVLREFRKIRPTAR